MTRLLRVYSGSDSSPVIDYTDDVNWVEAELASMAHNGESGVGQIGIYDPEGVIPDHVGAGKFLNSHNVVLVEDGPYRLFRGRINTRASSRRMRRGRRTKYITCNIGDYNQDLRGIVVDNLVRPLESNITRFQAVAATYLNGSPRATTVLNATTYVSGSNALILPAKTYTGMYVGDVLADIAREAGKLHFVTIDGELFYDGSESTAYASSLRISDDPADANATTYAPQWHAGDASTEDGIETASHIRSYYGTESSVTASTGQQAYNDYWETLWWDPLAEVESNAMPRAVARLQEIQDTLTVSCTIGPIPWAQLGSIKSGQMIPFKARAARGGRGPTGAFLGDSFITLRIAELRWKMPAPDTYFAVLQLGKPPLVSPYGTGSQALVKIVPLSTLGGGLHDSYTRTSARSIATPSTAWNTSDSGHIWTVTQTVSDVTFARGGAYVAGAYGYLVQDTADIDAFSTATAANVTEVEAKFWRYTCTFMVQTDMNVALGDLDEFDVSWQAPSGFVQAKIHWEYPVDADSYFNLFDGGNVFVHYPTVDFAVNVWFHMKMERNLDTNVTRLKIWRATSVEPDAWNVTTTTFDYRAFAHASAVEVYMRKADSDPPPQNHVVALVIDQLDFVSDETAPLAFGAT